MLKARESKTRLKTGFTLIELIIVIVVIAVITTAGLVSFSSISSRRVEAEARKVISDLSWARKEAVSRHKKYTVDFDTNNNVYDVYEGDTSGILVKRQNLDVDLVSITDFSGTSILPARVTFNYPLGTAQDRIVNLSGGGKTRAVKVFGETGYVRME